MTETMLKRDIMKYLQLRGFLVWKLSDRFRSGVPDLYAARDGRSYWFEIKKPTAGKVPELQKYEIRQLLLHGISAAVVRSIEDVKVIIKEV
jgi:Holliday junction resolvase